MEINITPQDVDQLVKDAILKAGIGRAVESAVTAMFSGYSSPIRTAVEKFVKEVASEMVREKYAPQIRDACDKYILKMVTEETIQTITHEVINKMVRAAAE